MRDFHSLPTTRKGKIGEAIVERWLDSHGIVSYAPVRPVPHAFDRLCHTADKSTFFALDVKTKPRRIYYPDTGIDLSDYRKYKTYSQSHGQRFLLVFVDESMGQVYGGWLDELDQTTTIQHKGRSLTYPLHGTDQGRAPLIYFPLQKMEVFGHLTDEERLALRRLNTSSYTQSTYPSARPSHG